MATATATVPKPRTTRTARTPAVSLVLTIGGTGYRVQPITSDFPGARAYRLVKLGPAGEVYDVIQNGPVLSCDCPDCIYRDHCCKHLEALLALRMLDPAPAPGGES